MLIGPMQPADNAGGVGGAAGNRTRVQSAYYVRVYLHSQGKPWPPQYGPYPLQKEEQTVREAWTAGGFPPIAAGRS